MSIGHLFGGFFFQCILERKGERGTSVRESNIDWLSPVHAHTRDHMHLDQGLGVCSDRESNLHPFSYGIILQPTESYRPGLMMKTLKINSISNILMSKKLSFRASLINRIIVVHGNSLWGLSKIKYYQCHGIFLFATFLFHIFCPYKQKRRKILFNYSTVMCYLTMRICSEKCIIQHLHKCRCYSLLHPWAVWYSHCY